MNFSLDNKSTFIFDMDGTLVNLEDLNIKGYTDTIKHFYNEDLTLDEYQKYYSGTKTAKAFNGYLDSKEISERNVDELIKYFRDLKREQLVTNTESVTSLLPGANEYLQRLDQEDQTLILATSTVKEFTDIILEHFSLNEIFGHILTAEDVTEGKPNPQIYISALEVSNSTRKESVVFEDSKNGIQAALNAEIDCVGVHTKGLNDDYVGKADYVISSYEELL